MCESTVKGCRATLVFRAEMHAFLLKEVKTDRLVTLRGNVHHIETILIDECTVCTIVQKSLTNFNVSPERCIVNCSEFIF